jgi:hypothetical protein
VNGEVATTRFIWDDAGDPDVLAVARTNRELQERYGHFKAAAERIAGDFSQLPFVKRIVLFGSVARPLFAVNGPCMAGGDDTPAVLHKCRDIDMAVWVSRTDRLNELRLRLDDTLRRYTQEKKYGVAHHQADIYIFEDSADAYVGRLCIFSQCPKGKYVCKIQGCGKPPFLRRFEDFVFNRSVFDNNASRLMFNAP